MKTILKYDELNVPTYEHTDVIVKSLTKRIIRVFENSKGILLNADAKRVIEYIGYMFTELGEATSKSFKKLGTQVYDDNSGVNSLPRDWLDDFLTAYSPASKIVWAHEFERKKARFEEAIIASKTAERSAEIDKAMRIYARMTAQEADEITDYVRDKAYVSRDVESVMWIALHDEKTCKECESRDKVVYSLTNVPNKHIHCRCWIIPVH